MITEETMIEVKRWVDTPESLRGQLVRLIDDPRPEARQYMEAINVYRAYHGVSQVEAKHAIVCLDKSLAPVTPCPSCGKPLRTALAQQCLECGADWPERPKPATH
jgi:hypothetical protein